MHATQHAPAAPSHPLAGEKLITILEVAKRFPGRSGSDKATHYTTIRRRILKGTRNQFTGEVVRLEAFRDGGRWITSEEALARYHEALNRRVAADRTEPTPGNIAPPKKRQAHTRAELKRLGL